MAVVTDMLAEIADGNTLLATYEDGEYAVWVDYGTKTNSASFESVTQAELDAVLAQRPDKVTVRRFEDNHTSREGYVVDAIGKVSDAGFHADILGDDKLVKGRAITEMSDETYEFLYHQKQPKKETDRTWPGCSMGGSERPAHFAERGSSALDPAEKGVGLRGSATNGGKQTMNDMTMMTTAQPRSVRRIRPKPQPLLLLPAWRVTTAAEAAALAREGRLRALAKAARRKVALQPVEVVYRNPDFQARVEALAARHVAPPRPSPRFAALSCCRFRGQQVKLA